MKWYHKVSLFLVAIGLLISDRWLHNSTPGLNASYFIYPFLLLSFFRFKLSGDRLLFNLLLGYFIIVCIYYIAGGFEGFLLWYTMAGTPLIAYAMLNGRLRYGVMVILMKYIIFLTLLSALAYYGGFWISREFAGERMTFMRNNENIMSHQMCIGMALSILAAYTSQTKKARLFYLLIFLVYIMPAVATISRTGIASLLITLVLFSYAKLRVSGSFVIVAAVLTASAWGLLPQFGFVMENKFYISLIERTEYIYEDDRVGLWSVGWELAKNNFITGVGFGNFSSDTWRKRVGQEGNLQSGDLSSVHNSFIDLILIGGIWLLIIYLMIIFIALFKGTKLLLSDNLEVRMIAASVISLNIGVILFTLTAQAGAEKKTWFTFAFCYLWLEEGKRRLKKSKTF